MTRRERLEAKAILRTEWAEKAQTRSEAAFKKAHNLAEQIPLGQPILQGHHSERHARADAARIDNAMHRGVEATHLAEHHAAKADGLAHQLDRSIFSDDDDAIAALEARIAEREQKAASMVALNKAWRASKGDVATFAVKAGISEDVAVQIASRIELAYSWEKQPVPAWELSNLRGTINSDKKRIEAIKARQKQSEKADNAGGILITGDEYVRVTFADKPARHVIDSLKSSGFHWSSGSWYGHRAKLPELT